MAKPLYLFVHIPKTGGTSISNMIKQSLGEASTWIVNADGLSLDDKTNLVMGHFPYGLHFGYPHRRPTYLTILRDPVDRLWSHYWSVIREPSHYMHERARELGPVHYMADRAVSHENDNTMTRMICGQGYWQENPRPMTPADLELAKRHLERFQVVGLFEQFDDTLALILDALHINQMDYFHDNLGHNKPLDIPADVREACEAVTVFDRALYEMGKGLFQQQLERLHHA